LVYREGLPKPRRFRGGVQTPKTGVFWFHPHTAAQHNLKEKSIENLPEQGEEPMGDRETIEELTRSYENPKAL